MDAGRMGTPGGGVLGSPGRADRHPARSGIGISMPYDAMDEANQLKLYIEGVMNR